MDWAEGAFAALMDYGVRQVAYVPDAGHRSLIERCHAEPSMVAVPLTTEEEGVALLVGAWLGGDRGVLLMQSSGVGNCINMFGLPRICRAPLLSLVTMRGEWGEFNSWQLAMGRNSESLLAQSGATVHRLEAAEQARETVAAAARIAFEGQTQASVLVAQRLIGIKAFATAGQD